ncbi:MAG: class I SAM-dependent methyltransferase [Deltaproteobacteria bacterium]|nr:class I SAM-dependent methyltransferase [Deltaproteobacteria bacterium]
MIEEALNREIDPAFAERARLIFEYCRRKRPQAVIDVGCGRGFYLRGLAELGIAERIVGIDKSQANVALAAEHCRGLPSVNIINADVAALPAGDNEFDLAICSEVLEHLARPEEAMREIARVLQPGGTLLITVPNYNFPALWDPLNFLLMRVFGSHVPKHIHWLAGIWADHERLYDSENLTRLVTPLFELKTVEPVLRHCWPFSHLLLYGIGKNLLEAGIGSSLSRFSSNPTGRLPRALAKLMGLPARLLPGKPSLDCSVNLFLCATKPL